MAGRPGGEQLEAVGRRGVRGRGVDVELQAGLGRQLHRLEVEVELADDRMAHPLSAGSVKAHVLGRPPLPEQLTARGQFTDQARSAPRRAGCGPPRGEHRGRVAGDLVVVDEELLAASGFKYTNRVVFAGRRGSASTGEYSARASWFIASTSWRPLRIQAGASVMASSTCCSAGRTVTGVFRVVDGFPSRTREQAR